MLSDANEYAKITGDRPFKAGQYTQNLSSTWAYTGADECDAQSWYGEETLDVESVHGQAPDAKVVYVGAASCEDSDLLDGLAAHRGKSTWPASSAARGANPTIRARWSRLQRGLQAGAAEGIGFFFSSGDSGYEDPGGGPGLGPAAGRLSDLSPYVTSVGGTSLAIGSSKNYEFETSWGTLLDPLATGGKSWE